MLRRIGILLCGAAAPILLVAFLVGGRWAEWLAAACCATLPVALSALGLGRRGPPARRLGLVLLLLLVLLAAGFFTILLLPPGGTPRAGMPLASWVMLCGLGLAPLLLVGIGHALAFDGE